MANKNNKTDLFAIYQSDLGEFTALRNNGEKHYDREVFFKDLSKYGKRRLFVMPQLSVFDSCVLPGSNGIFDCSDYIAYQGAMTSMDGNGLVFIASLLSNNEQVNLSEFAKLQANSLNVREPELVDFRDTAYKQLKVGVIGQILSLQDDDDNNSTRVLIQVLCRAELVKQQSDGHIDLVQVKPLVENYSLHAVNEQLLCEQFGFKQTELSTKLKERDLTALLAILRLYFDKWLAENKTANELAKYRFLYVKQELDKICDEISETIPLSYVEKLYLLTCEHVVARLYLLLDLIKRDLGMAHLRRTIDQKTDDFIRTEQRDYVIRNTIKLLRKELSNNSEDEEISILRKKLAALSLPDAARLQLKECIDKLARFGTASVESANLSDYIDLCLSLPWGKMAPEHFDIKSVQAKLEQDHYGLEKVKKRILQYLAMRHLRELKQSNGKTVELLCLIGPPGIGKTSIARSIAEALGRPLERISLGGVDDESEIRGHRRTYIGAMPGRIIKAIQSANCDNPVILLDEIDKLAYSVKGDPAAALLEVLDGEQNDKFRDNYVDLPYDLSKVLFIVTANDYEAIPAALYDRMDVVNLSSYTANEKLQIAKHYLWPNILASINYSVKQIKISDSCLRYIISNYTREAGVRQLERCLKTICRAIATEILSKDDETAVLPISVKKRNLADYLGVAPYLDDELHMEDLVGVVTGLAWTYVGGVTLEVEVKISQGNGKIHLTGNLGDVMKESASVAWTYLISQAAKLNLAACKWQELDVHIHIPEGATPKDGPSAGVTLATALYSALTNVKVKHKVAMTGELTLTGRVFPIGGLKEKLMAAYRAKIKTVLIPKANVKDLEDIDNEVKEGLEIIPVTRIEEVFEQALVKETASASATISSNVKTNASGNGEVNSCDNDNAVSNIADNASEKVSEHAIS